MCVKKQKLHVRLGQPLLAGTSPHDQQSEVIYLILKTENNVHEMMMIWRMLLIETEQNVTVVHKSVTRERQCHQLSRAGALPPLAGQAGQPTRPGATDTHHHHKQTLSVFSNEEATLPIFF